MQVVFSPCNVESANGEAMPPFGWRHRLATWRAQIGKGGNLSGGLFALRPGEEKRPLLLGCYSAVMSMKFSMAKNRYMPIRPNAMAFTTPRGARRSAVSISG